ncbi:hypothetical protein BN1723_013799 [Verticillium longisporum]|uniref:Threonine/serine exporter-like N-terminal domain-containing protein n=1 Tax=Verticillium longisporum TaxID=100787 RepID=A0A0G4LVV9_VERLO|nr:hypothetical protein BN1723_013799 [Verticillium longisporum]
MADHTYRSDSSSLESRDPSGSPAPATASTQTHDGIVIPEPPRPEYSRSNSDTPNKKEKKRHSLDDGYLSPSSPTPDPFATPRPEDDHTGDGPEPAELRRALTQILITESENNEPTAPAIAITGPARPRPAIKRNTSYDVPDERQKADWAEQRASERQQRSGAEARQHADRLAVSVERSYSLPPSRRGSLDRTAESLAEEDEEADSVATGLDTSRFADAGVVRSRPRKNSHLTAENLVRTHTQRGRRRGGDEMFRFRPEEGAASRPATPTEEKNYAQEYVPRPEKYHGGILGSLLKLYNDGGKDSGDNSGRTTPMTATPNPSPPVSQPPSRPWLQLIVAPNNELYANVFEITAAIITSFLARAFGSIRGGQLFCFSALAQSSIALILPGYMVLCSSLELQSHNLVAGSVRMVYAMIYTLFLGYGITIGTAIYGLVDREHAVSDTFCHNPLDRKWHLLFVPAFTLCLCVVNQAKWKQTPVMLGISLAGFVVNSYSSDYFQGNTQISNMLGALTVGILANLYSRLGRHVNTAWFEFVDWFQLRVAPRFRSSSRRHNERPAESYQMHGHTPLDVESRPSSPNSIEREKAEHEPPRKQRTVGYGLAAAAMLPAIFVQVPSGLAAGGSLLAGVTSADQITSGSNGTSTGGAGGQELNTSAFNVLFAVIQVAIGITVGLFLSALIVYPLGKRGGGRSGLLSF